ncbi:hypothetical protein NPIL_296141 [Nephila pilipes]|uniref:Uncharacterized protein n=1 Tax=Nephila pilipes TaxID=299642 RepID=A0A8X6QLC5_NEPPI|nr:hypothetical protein NPIL_296141 [Nephila pilipes]
MTQDSDSLGLSLIQQVEKKKVDSPQGTTVAHLQVVFSGQRHPFSKIAEVRVSPFTPNVYAVSGRSEQSSDSPHSTLNEMVALRGEIAALSKQVERLSRD